MCNMLFQYALAAYTFPFFQDGWTPLMIASEQGNLHIVNMLMDNGAHVNLQDKVL